MLVNVSIGMLHVGAIILLAGMLVMYVWRSENDALKNKAGLGGIIVGIAMMATSVIAVTQNFIILWNV